MVAYKSEVQVQQDKLYGPYFMELKISVNQHIYQNIYVSWHLILIHTYWLQYFSKYKYCLFVFYTRHNKSDVFFFFLLAFM